MTSFIHVGGLKGPNNPRRSWAKTNDGTLFRFVQELSPVLKSCDQHGFYFFLPGCPLRLFLFPRVKYSDINELSK